ncbi:MULTISPECIES: GWxTD domain-containing protein [Spirosoma]|uniref:GWxTD domain-containing protein n=1 Tax=Spirosoma liriopis TaxID=2937440 RepID=A0ABT0HG56_9BACT|nr:MULTISPECIES: GWxTD domain-containing protein [Spirosoma]MCK8491128.1 GWxTD domain-containing protein [Spirosoma liriopis]UHG90507.1 GWxTD domain-containing protein [Spirosoma oryzicola]
MRILSAILFIAFVSACSSSKKTQQDRATAAYEARTEARRNSPQSDSRPSAPATAAPIKLNDGPTTTPSSTPTAGPKQVGEWVVTSIKGKFLAVDTSSVRVYMNLTAKTPKGEPVLNPAEFVEHFQMAYVMYPDYNNRERLGYGTIPLSTQNVSREGDYLTLMFDVKRPKDAANAVLLTEITEMNTGTKARNDLSLRFKGGKLSDRFALFDKKGTMPQLRNYVNAGDTVIIRDVSGASKPLYGFRYRHDFEAASSPMNTSPKPAPKSLNVDSTLSITTNQPFIIPREGLYYFVEDTTAETGIGLVVSDKRFPKMTRPEKLIKPVLYMSTSSEFGELAQAQDTKKAFDRYWLGLMSGNEEVARKTLKAYFDRVEEANRLFTTYKEGWKTDKGMIYIVLGAPDRVQRNREREVWVYNRRANVSEVNFTFTKKPNQFVEDHYELVRYIEYQPIWYPIVEAWRTGAIRE